MKSITAVLNIILLIPLSFKLSCAPVSEKKVLNVLYHPSKHSPFEKKTEDESNPKGFSIILAHRIADSLGYEVNFVSRPFQSIITEVENGSHRKAGLEDAIAISSISVTEKRKKSLLFSNRYFATGLGLMVHSSQPFNSLEEVLDFKNSNTGRFVFGALNGSTGKKFIEEKIGSEYTEITVKGFDQIDLMFQDIEGKQPKIHGIILDQVVLLDHWFRKKEIEENTYIFARTINREDWAVVMHKADRVLCRQINELLNSYVGSQEFYDDLARSMSKDVSLRWSTSEMVSTFYHQTASPN
ncbi:MAG: transporter substrate-binding domain-containing protein [Verrucomicrobiota bacterium]